jgi:hypothetical protein
MGHLAFTDQLRRRLLAAGSWQEHGPMVVKCNRVYVFVCGDVIYLKKDRHRCVRVLARACGDRVCCGA